MTQNFLQGIGFKTEFPTLVLVLTTKAGESLTASTLREFRTNVLNRDDVFRPEFFTNVVFVGAKEADLCIEPSALDELAIWGVKSKAFVAANGTPVVPPGPYVFGRGKTWQPWRIYHDFNSCFMTAFKPSLKAPTR